MEKFAQLLTAVCVFKLFIFLKLSVADLNESAFSTFLLRAPNI